MYEFCMSCKLLYEVKRFPSGGTTPEVQRTLRGGPCVAPVRRSGASVREQLREQLRAVSNARE